MGSVKSSSPPRKPRASIPPSVRPFLCVHPTVCASIHLPTPHPHVHLLIRPPIHSFTEPPISRSSSPSLPVHSPAVLRAGKPGRPEVKSLVRAPAAPTWAPALPAHPNGASVLTCPSLSTATARWERRECKTQRFWENRKRPGHGQSLVSAVFWTLLVSTAIKRRKRGP